MQRGSCESHVTSLQYVSMMFLRPGQPLTSLSTPSTETEQ